MHKISKAAVGAATLALVGIGVPVAMATSVAPDATLVYAAPLAPITFNDGVHYPGAYGLDLNGDKQADVYGYCAEAGVDTGSAVRAQTQTLAAYDSTTRTFLQDAGRTRWVAHNGFGAVDTTQLVAKAGLSVSLAAGSSDYDLMESATQAAIWRFSQGLTISPTWHYGTTAAANTNFFKLYNYLVDNATADSTSAVVYDEKSGEAKTQAIIVVTPPGQPTPEPTKTTDAPAPAPTTTAPEPTKTTQPAPAPTTTTPEPTKTTTTAVAVTPAPDAAIVSTAGLWRITMSNNAFAPGVDGLDLDGDKKADVTGYCIEPSVMASSGALAGTQKLGAQDLTTRAGIVDAGRLAWVAQHGFGALTGPQLAAAAGITVNMTSGSTDISMLQSATQAAVWKYSSNLTVNPLWHFGYTSADNTKFWAVYNYLVKNAVPADTHVTVYDEKPGQPSTQGVVVVTPPPAPAPEPTKTVTPTPEPTKTVTPSPTDCSCVDPTKTVAPTADPTKIG